jgi:hypothetical protein
MSDEVGMTVKAAAAAVAALLVFGGGGACSTPAGGGPAGRGGSSSAGAAGTSAASGSAGAAGAAGESGNTGTAGAAGSGGVVVDAGTDLGGGTNPGACSKAPTPAAGATVIDVSAPSTLAGALASAKAGDRIVLHAGSYANETISNRKFDTPVFVEAAAGDTVVMAGGHFTSCDHLSFSGITFSATVMLDGSANFTFHGVTLDGGASEEAALQIHGQGSAGASHDVLVEASTIRGGGRTIFVLGKFAPSDAWNHHLSFIRDDITCGSHNCFQISGGRDIVIDGNRINGTTTAGVLTAGATRVAITRNRMKGMSGMSPCATQIASPGMEWDNYAGVENMISSAIVIANNVVDGWSSGVQLDAARDVAVVYNTVADGTGVRFNHRTPHDQMGNVILNGNSDIRIWNDILPSIALASGETKPAFESNNVIWKGGGGGPGDVTSMPIFAAGAADYALAPGSPGIDAALINAETPLVDFENRTRGAMPDVGAREYAAPVAACP